jgi:hypothetical protein
MTIHDFLGTLTVLTHDELRQALQRRHALDVNEFWLRGPDNWPVVAIQVTGDWAVVHFFPEDGHPGFLSNTEVAVVNEPVGFHTCQIGQLWHPPVNRIVSFGAASLVANQFFEDEQSRPMGVDWLEL